MYEGAELHVGKGDHLTKAFYFHTSVPQAISLLIDSFTCMSDTLIVDFVDSTFCSWWKQDTQRLEFNVTITLKPLDSRSKITFTINN